MGLAPSKQTFDDIVHQLRENDITVTSKHSDKRYLYAVMKKNSMIFVARQCIKTESFSLKHPDHGIFYFDTVEEALNIVNSLSKTNKDCLIMASLWDADRLDERELRFSFHTYDLIQAAREYERLKTNLVPLGLTLKELTPKLQAVCIIPQVNADSIKTEMIVDFGIQWQDFSKKPLKVVRTA